MIVIESDLFMLALIERAQVLLGIEIGHYEKQKKPGQLVHCFLDSESWASTSSK